MFWETVFGVGRSSKTDCVVGGAASSRAAGKA